MSVDDHQSKMEEVNYADDGLKIEIEQDKVDVTQLENTAEDMMTDMKLEDEIEIDEVRSIKPDFNWLYHIEIYPWNADDMTENFVRLIKLSQFSQVCMRKKRMGKETNDLEKVDDKLSGRLRIGCLHLYTNTSQNAKNIMRSATWKTMSSKQLMIELTKQGPDPGQLETATLELDTYMASKSRFRDKPKGELKDRSAKVSNLPGTISREFLDVVFSRAYAVVEGTTIREYLKEKEGKLQQKLLELRDFNGSLDFDCLGRGSCRAFVLAHKSVFINGQKLSIDANDKETMVVPPYTHEPNLKQENVLTQNTPQNKMRGAAAQSTNPAVRGIKPLAAQGFSKESVTNNFRGRGLGRAAAVLPRPATASFTRAGPGMPVPMTGRQKMNEKMRRNHFGMAVASSGLAIAPGIIGNRGSALNSVGDSFKQELESLQNQLERSTQALEAKIAMLQQSSQAVGYYQGDVLDQGDWEEDDFQYASGYCPEVMIDNCYESEQAHNFHFNPHHTMRMQRPKSGSFLATSAMNMGQMTTPKLHQALQQGQMMTDSNLHQGNTALWRGDSRRVGRRGRGQMRGVTQNFW